MKQRGLRITGRTPIATVLPRCLTLLDKQYGPNVVRLYHILVWLQRSASPLLRKPLWFWLELSYKDLLMMPRYSELQRGMSLSWPPDPRLLRPHPLRGMGKKSLGGLQALLRVLLEQEEHL